jgi:hypothetical protein
VKDIRRDGPSQFYGASVHPVCQLSHRVNSLEAGAMLGVVEGRKSVVNSGLPGGQKNAL